MAINDPWDGRWRTLPRWTCPTCQNGHLRLDGEIVKKETGPSVQARDDPAWEPDWIVQRYTAVLACDNADCGEVATISGKTSLSPIHTDEEEDWVETYLVQAINPSPIPIAIGPEVPDDIAQLLRSAAQAYWVDAEAAANKLRQATEVLLDFEGVRKTIVNRRGRRDRLTLHARIVQYEAVQPELGKLLLAVKWIGNAGSHVGGLTKKDVLDGFEILSHVIDDLYHKRKAKAVALAKKVNKKAGPLSRTRRR